MHAYFQSRDYCVADTVDFVHSTGDEVEVVCTTLMASVLVCQAPPPPPLDPPSARGAFCLFSGLVSMSAFCLCLNVFVEDLRISGPQWYRRSIRV